MGRIRVLDESTVNKIAAGEVVESPSSVIKELLENSLDAGSARIGIDLDGGGIDRIRVQDDGCGMSREDAILAFTRHSTSKISGIDDLLSLHTLGFRGEALASIAAVSRVEMVTRERGSPSGTRISIQAGKVLSIEEAGCPEGTSITVSDLFANVPARKKFLKGPQTEKARCLDVATRLALIRPDIGFRITSDDEPKLEAPPGQDLRSRAGEVLGLKTARSMKEIGPLDCGMARVEGLASLPWDTRSNSGGITICVSGRLVKNRQIIDSVRRGYGSRLMKGRYPLSILIIDISSQRMDVNIHPTKDLVKFSDERSVLECVERAVGKAVFGGPMSKRPSGKSPPPQAEPVDRSIFNGSRVRAVREKRQVPLLEGEVRPSETPMDQWADVPVIEGMSRLPPALPENPSQARIRVIGQLDHSYILCELGSDLLLVDQHAAHERIRLEMLSKKHSARTFPVQELIDPIHLEMDPSSMENIGSLEADLKGLGFDFERFGRDAVVIRGLPVFMGRTEGSGVLLDIAMGAQVHDGCGPPDPSFVPKEIPLKDKVISLAACKGAIKAHQQLSFNEMEALIRDLLDCEIPLHCAHGRPTMIRLPLSSLERWFRRIV
ncbi:MAG: DNA mismatch repair endonuclease MutL [Candidatus Thermoplasmatota archaeon]|nr:DNA mismatch repair endonuclease MutL [Candidatus Thermoplasmatota archaeon]